MEGRAGCSPDGMKHKLNQGFLHGIFQARVGTMPPPTHQCLQGGTMHGSLPTHSHTSFNPALIIKKKQINKVLELYTLSLLVVGICGSSWLVLANLLGVE